MLIVAFLFGFGAAFDKFVVVHGNVLTRLLLAWYFGLGVMLIILLPRGKPFFKKSLAILKHKWKWFFLLAVFDFTTLTMQFIGISLTVTAYITLLKRTAALFAVIGAYFLFNEKKDIKNALIGTMLLVLGVALLTL